MGFKKQIYPSYDFVKKLDVF